MATERLIRKYANRRLYDSTASRHVTLADLRQLVVAGERIKVLDDKSGEDLTRAVLLQIIADQEQFGAPTLSTELLEMIIRFYASPMQSMFTDYLEQGFGALLRQQDSMRAELSKALAAAPLAPFADLARANMDAFTHMQAAFFGAVSPPTGAAAKPQTRGGGPGAPADAAPSKSPSSPDEGK